MTDRLTNSLLLVATLAMLAFLARGAFLIHERTERLVECVEEEKRASDPNYAWTEQETRELAYYCQQSFNAARDTR